MKFSNELAKTLASVKNHLAMEQPTTMEAGQVWQILPKSEDQEAILGVITEKNLLFITVVMLRRDYDKDSMEGNNRCFYRADETNLESDFIAAYWCPFTPLLKSSFGRYICTLSNEIVEKIKAAKEFNLEPATLEGQWFRAECTSKSKALGYKPIKLLNPIINLNNALQNIMPTFGCVARCVANGLAAAQKKDKNELFKNFENRLCDELIKEGTDFGDNIYKEYVSVSDNEFRFTLEKDISLIFFDKEGEALGEVTSDNKEIVFAKASLDEILLQYAYIAYCEN